MVLNRTGAEFPRGNFQHFPEVTSRVDLQNLARAEEV